MDVSEAPDGSLLLTYDGRLWSRWLFGLALVFAATAVYDLTLGTRGDERLIALIGGIVTLAGSGALMYETARWRVDRFNRVITWERRWGIQRRAGTLRFDAIRFVAIEVPIGDEGVPSRRIVLHTGDGELIPVTIGYRPDTDGAIMRAAESLRQMVGLDAKPSGADTVRALVASGRTIDAIKMLVDEEKLSLADAKARLDELRKTNTETQKHGSTEPR